MTIRHLIIYTYILFGIFIHARNTLNVGTVLFTNIDLYKSCWSADDIALLTARMIFEDLMPKPDLIVINNDEFVEDIICYFNTIIRLIRTSTDGRNKHLTLLAITDLLGGYLQHILYPNAKYAYYAGVIGFQSVFKVKQLFEEIKWFLRTNGEGWAIETHDTFCPEVPPLTLKATNSSNSCDRIIYYDSSIMKKRSTSDNSIEIFMPLPFFDSKTNPSAIAIPYVHYSLRNIETRKSANLVQKYYVTAIKCLNDKSANKATMDKFQDNLYTWITYDVVPKLHDEKFYAAFGGVLRVSAALAAAGAKKVELTTEIGESDSDDASGTETAQAITESSSGIGRSKVILIMIICILLWFIFAVIYICYKISKANKANRDFRSTPTNTSESTSCKKSGASVCACSSDSKSNRFSFLPSKATICKSVGTGTEESEKHTSSKKGKRSKSSCCCAKCPAVIDTDQSMKNLPSLEEISEKDFKKNRSSSKKISFDDSSITSKGTRKICVQSLSTFTSKSKNKIESSKPSEKSSQDLECWCPYSNDSTYSGATASDLSSSHNNSNVYQVSVLSNPLSDKTNIFGYDFHTTTSESSPDDDLDFDLNTSLSTTK